MPPKCHFPGVRVIKGKCEKRERGKESKNEVCEGDEESVCACVGGKEKADKG